MTTILDKIIAQKTIELEKQKQEIPLKMLEKRLETVQSRSSFKQALQQSPTGIIAEFKRRSPSKDWLFKDARIEDVVPLYSQNGAAAISVLTDLSFFGGSLDDLLQASALTDTPLLRKDFMIDEYQLVQAKIYGASAILLIAAALTPGKTKKLAAEAKALGLEVLLEIHQESELEHLTDTVDVIGVNNRDLARFRTDVRISLELADKIPSGWVKISESGISSVQTVKELQQAGYQGFLMGENFMKTPNPGKALGEFIHELEQK
jgi:indole-3-glycerol phosphate synthase